MRILVTGGGGFLGRSIVEQLIARGDSVRTLARRGSLELQRMGVDVLQGDVRDPQAVLDAVSGQDAVIHAAAVPGIWGRWKDFYEINTLGTQHILDACRRHHVGRLVYTSSPSVVFDGKSHLNGDESLPYPERHLCHYPKSKALAEQRVLSANGSDLSTVALRPHLIWGPRDPHLIPRLIQKAGQGQLRQVGDGKNVVSVAYVENAAAAHLQALTALRPGASCAGRAYFINDPEPVSLWGWVNQLLAFANLPPVTRSVSPAVAWTAGAILEGAYHVLRLSGEPPMTRFLALQLSQSHAYSIQRAIDDFGYAPVVPHEIALQRTADWIRALAQR